MELLKITSRTVPWDIIKEIVADGSLHLAVDYCGLASIFSTFTHVLTRDAQSLRSYLTSL